MPSLCERVQKDDVKKPTKQQTQKSVKNHKAPNGFENTCIPYIAQTRLKLSIIAKRQSSEQNEVS